MHSRQKAGFVSTITAQYGRRLRRFLGDPAAQFRRCTGFGSGGEHRTEASLPGVDHLSHNPSTFRLSKLECPLKN